jgi:hypothetical protein
LEDGTEKAIATEEHNNDAWIRIRRDALIEMEEWA